MIKEKMHNFRDGNFAVVIIAVMASVNKIFSTDDTEFSNSLYKKNKNKKNKHFYHYYLAKSFKQSHINNQTNMQTCSTIELSINGILCWLNFHTHVYVSSINFELIQQPETNFNLYLL